MSGTGGIFSLFSNFEDFEKIPTFLELLADPSRPEIPPEAIPENLRNKLREIIESGKGPVFNAFLSAAHAQIDGMTPEDVVDFILGSEEKPGLSKDQFLALFKNNEGAGNVISAALEKQADKPLIELLADQKIKVDSTMFSSDASILGKKLSEVGSGEFSGFINGLSDEDTKTFLYQLPVGKVRGEEEPTGARAVIEKLGLDEKGQAIEGFPKITLSDTASREDIKAAIEQALDARVEHEKGFKSTLSYIFGNGGAKEGVLSEIRMNLGATIQTELNTSKEMLAKLNDTEEFYKFLTDPNNKQKVFELVQKHMEQIKAELKKPKNMLFLFDANPDDFTREAVEWARDQLDRFPMLRKLLEMFMPFVKSLLGMAKKFFGVEDGPQETSPSPDTARDGFTDAASGQPREPAAEPAADPSGGAPAIVQPGAGGTKP